MKRQPTQLDEVIETIKIAQLRLRLEIPTAAVAKRVALSELEAARDSLQFVIDWTRFPPSTPRKGPAKISTPVIVRLPRKKHK